MLPVHLAILGGGLAGLSLLYHLEKAGKLKDKRVLLVDPEGRKTTHDRSWSYWEKAPGPFEALVYHRWDQVTVHSQAKDAVLDINPYSYKLIRSTEFYAHVNEVIDGITGLERINDRALNIKAEGDKVYFQAGGQDYVADLAFSSLPLHLRPRQIRAPYLDQHFRGWFIKTEEEVFDPERA
ncbi:MAG: lycopene cyclase family protein, partial [Bacteroidota bacterium]